MCRIRKIDIWHSDKAKLNAVSDELSREIQSVKQFRRCGDQIGVGYFLFNVSVTS